MLAAVAIAVALAGRPAPLCAPERRQPAGSSLCWAAAGETVYDFLFPERADEVGICSFASAVNPTSCDCDPKGEVPSEGAVCDFAARSSCDGGIALFFDKIGSEVDYDCKMDALTPLELCKSIVRKRSPVAIARNLVGGGSCAMASHAETAISIERRSSSRLELEVLDPDPGVLAGAAKPDRGRLDYGAYRSEHTSGASCPSFFDFERRVPYRENGSLPRPRPGCVFAFEERTGPDEETCAALVAGFDGSSPGSCSVQDLMRTLLLERGGAGLRDFLSGEPWNLASPAVGATSCIGPITRAALEPGESGRWGPGAVTSTISYICRIQDGAPLLIEMRVEEGRYFLSRYGYPIRAASTLRALSGLPGQGIHSFLVDLSGAPAAGSPCSGALGVAPESPGELLELVSPTVGLRVLMTRSDGRASLVGLDVAGTLDGVLDFRLPNAPGSSLRQLMLRWRINSGAQ